MAWRLRFQGRGKFHTTLRVTRQITVVQKAPKHVGWSINNCCTEHNYFMLGYSNGVFG